MPSQDAIIGIDLGTTNSLVAVADERGPRILPGPGGQRLCPSVVHIDPASGVVTVGAEARRHAVECPLDTLYSVKRLMGRSIDDVAGELPHLSYRVEPRPGGGGIVDLLAGGRRLTPQEVSAMILAELRGYAESALGHEVRKAVVTVPAYFDDAQRQATRDAGAIAGLEVLRIVNEPTAAALAYGLDRVGEGTVAVYDLGGGTFDISILRIESGVFDVLSTNGDTHLGGDDIDRALMGLVQEEIRAAFGQAIDFDPSTRQAIRGFAEAVKIDLSQRAHARIEIDLGGGRVYRRTLRREDLEALAEPLLRRTLERCAIALRDARQTPADIDRVVLVGGSTYMPLVRQRVSEFFQAEAYTALNPMEVVALGAAVQASILAGVNRDLLLRDIVPLSLGIETMGGAVAKLIAKGTAIPCRATEMFSTYVDGQTNVKIHVLQGERELAQDCRSLGQFTLSDVPPMPAGLPKVQVQFLVDASGILTVSAVEQRSGQKASIQVVPSHGLDRAEVQQMVRDSVRFARQDMLEHRLIDLRNQASLDMAAIEKSLGIVGDEVEPGYRDELEGLMRDVRGLIPSQDADALHAALRRLDAASARLGEMAIARTLRDHA